MSALAPTVAVGVLIFAGLLGLAIGSFLNVVVYRVPAGISLVRESRCPSCGTAVRAWQNVPVVSWMLLRGRCAACTAPISARYPLVEAFTALAFVAVTGWVLSTPALGNGGGWGATIAVLAAYLYLTAVGIALTLIDLDTRRLPDAIVLPSYAVGIGLLIIACLAGAEWTTLLRAGVGMAVLFAFYLVLRLVRSGGMGGGDVKLAGVLGLHLAWVGWGALAVGGFAAFALGGLFGVALLVRRRLGRKAVISFGPWMIAGAAFGLFLGEPIAHGYVSMLGVA